MLALSVVRDLLARRAAGEALTDAELANLQRSAGTLRRRLDRLCALYPELTGEVGLSAELDELAQPPVLSASN